MASINTEQAARRLARVILSDIELYNRERPKPGETLEQQIEEGRRLFATRVTPDLLPVFGLVLSDRAAGRASSPAATEPPSMRVPAAVSSDDASPTPKPTIQDLPTPLPAIAARSCEDQPTPPPTVAAPPRLNQRPVTASVPTTPVAAEPPSVPAQARLASPPAHEIAIPVLTARFSIRRLLAMACVVAATIAVLYLLLP